MTRTMTRWLATAFAASWAHGAMAGALNLQEPTTPIAQQIYTLHTWILLVCVVIFVLVFGAMFYSIFKHRKSVGHKAAQFHESTTVEIIWTIIPFLILMGMAYPATKTVIEMKDTSNPDLTIKATGYQWKWGYEYVKGEGTLSGVSDGIALLFLFVLVVLEAPHYLVSLNGERVLFSRDDRLLLDQVEKLRIVNLLHFALLFLKNFVGESRHDDDEQY